MSEELTFRADRMRAILLLPAAIIFVVGGYSMRAEYPLIAWVVMIFFGLSIPFVLMQILRPKSAYLRLDSEGFEIGTFAVKKRTKWTDVEGFQLGSVSGAKMIQIIYAPSYKEQAAYRAVASGLSGMEGAIANNYEAPLDEILKTLNEWHLRYGKSG